MIWQEIVFTAGSIVSMVVLAPTLTDRTATVPLGTSLPSALLGFIYGAAFVSMGLVFSAVGAFATGLLWSLIALLRSPRSPIRQSSPDHTHEDGHVTPGD